MAIEKSKLSSEEIEKIVLELGEKGLTSEKIGLHLLKEHKIKSRKAGIKISKILKKHKLYVYPDKQNIAKSLENLKKHIAKNKQDYNARRAMITEEAKLRKQTSLNL